jgi:hypothetical protein
MQPQGDRISLARTGENMTPRTLERDMSDKPDAFPGEPATPRSSVLSSDNSQTSSALGRLMEYVYVLYPNSRNL